MWENAQRILDSTENEDGLVSAGLLDGKLPEEALAAIEAVQPDAPLLAMRLRLARVFGLTKLEALSVNPSTAMRPWGLVVGHNRLVAKARLCEPRAVPATTPEAFIEMDRNEGRMAVRHGHATDGRQGGASCARGGVEGGRNALAAGGAARRRHAGDPCR